MPAVPVPPWTALCRTQIHTKVWQLTEKTSVVFYIGQENTGWVQRRHGAQVASCSISVQLIALPEVLYFFSLGYAGIKHSGHVKFDIYIYKIDT